MQCEALPEGAQATEVNGRYYFSEWREASLATTLQLLFFAKWMTSG
jgi:hypothetical protein